MSIKDKKSEDMVPDDVVRVNGDGIAVEGSRRPSSDTPALLYIFHNRKIKLLLLQ